MAKPGRNDPCPCGSGKKYKKCHEQKQQPGWRSSRILMLVVGGVVAAAIATAVASFNSAPSTPAGERIWSSEHGHYHNANGVQVP
jgi:hypothetical protein